MMTFFLPALVIGLIGALPFLLGFLNRQNEMFWYPAFTAGYTAFGWTFFYFGLWSHSGPLLGGYSALLFIFLLISGIIKAISLEKFRPMFVPIGFLLLILFASFSGCAAFRSHEYYNLIGSVKKSNWATDMAPIDTKHVREVSKEQAEWLGNKALGQDQGALGSRYKPGEYTIQDVAGELYWVSPLEFQGFGSWQRYGYTSGYILVSAEDKDREAELRTGYQLKYLPSAWFGKNLNRLIFASGYDNVRLREFSFELDDNFKPWFVVTVLKPVIAYSGEEVLGVVVVDPEVGDPKFYKKDEVPDWIDRVVPEETAEEYLVYWGKYAKGWINSFYGPEGVIIPTPSLNSCGQSAPDVWLVKTQDGRRCWFTGMTSTASTDQALVGFALMDSRTGETRYYQMSGNNEEAVVDVINSAVSNYSGFRATQPILYNIWGEKSWVAAVINGQGIFQRLAIVRASNSAIVLGNSKRDVLNAYKRLLVESGSKVAPTSTTKLTSRVVTVNKITTVVQNGNTVFYLYTKTIPDRLFLVNPSECPEVIAAEPGESVNISYNDTDEGVVTVSSFDLESFQLKQSDTQVEFETTHKQAAEEHAVRVQARDSKAKLENMSPEELNNLLKLKENQPAEKSPDTSR